MPSKCSPKENEETMLKAEKMEFNEIIIIKSLLLYASKRNQVPWRSGLCMDAKLDHLSNSAMELSLNSVLVLKDTGTRLKMCPLVQLSTRKSDHVQTMEEQAKGCQEEATRKSRRLKAFKEQLVEPHQQARVTKRVKRNSRDRTITYNIRYQI